jgi:hypothetical protein
VPRDVLTYMCPLAERKAFPTELGTDVNRRLEARRLGKSPINKG